MKNQKKVKKLKTFYHNLITYVVVNVFLIVINLITSPDQLWFYWVTIFWGISLAITGARIFMTKNEFLSSEWEEKKIKEILEKENNKE